MAAVSAAAYALAMETQRAEAEALRRSIRSERRQYQRRQSWDTLAPPPAPSKCLACGSHGFQPHRGRHVCAYCRTAAG